MLTQQVRVLRGMASGTVFSLLYTLIAFILMPKLIDNYNLSEKIVYAIRWDAIAILMLVAGIAKVATIRFFSEDSITGEIPKESKSRLGIDVRYIQNTLEQYILLFITHLTLASIIASQNLPVIAILVSLFIIGRLSFWIGYHKDPVARAFGFVTTFYPTIITLFYCIIQLIMKLISLSR